MFLLKHERNILTGWVGENAQHEETKMFSKKGNNSLWSQSPPHALIEERPKWSKIAGLIQKFKGIFRMRVECYLVST